VGDRMKLTLEQLKFLKTIYEIQKKNELNVALTREIVSYVRQQKNITDGAVRKMIHVLYKKGYITSPLHGAWRVTKKGEKVLLQ